MLIMATAVLVLPKWKFAKIKTYLDGDISLAEGDVHPGCCFSSSACLMT